MDANEAERQIAELKKQLEAAKTATPPAAGFMGALSPVLSVASLVPRWLVVAAGVVVVAWAGFEIYINAQTKVLQLDQTNAQTKKTVAEAKYAEELAEGQKAQAESAKEQAASAHAQSCTAQMSLLFGGAVYQFYLNDLPDTQAGRKLITECGDYLNDGQREQFTRKDAADAEEKRRAAKIAPVPTDEERQKVQDDLMLKAFGFKRTGSQVEDEKLICTAMIALALMRATDLDGDEVLKEVRTPGSKLVEMYKVPIGSHDDRALKCVMAMTAH